MKKKRSFFAIKLYNLLPSSRVCLKTTPPTHKHNQSGSVLKKVVTLKIVYHMSTFPQTATDQLKQISALDTAITLVLQDLDRSLSETNQTLTERVIPAVTQYSQHLRNVRQHSLVLENLFTRAKSLNSTASQQLLLCESTPPMPVLASGGLAPVPEEASSDFDSFV